MTQPHLRQLHFAAGYLIYVADATGYLASVLVLLYKHFGAAELSWKEFFIVGSYGLACLGRVAIALSYVYFMWKSKSAPESPSVQVAYQQV